MTINSVGYAGTVSDEQWARLIPSAGGANYTVESYGAFRVTAASGTRTVQVAASTDGAAGFGVRDVSDSVISKTLDSVPSGTRWDLIALRRNWATKESTIEVVQGGSAKAIPGPPARNTTPGTLDDQPLALARVAAGSPDIQEIVDLRCSVQNGGAVAWDDLARSYLDQLGTELRIGATAWSRVTDAAGSPVWVSSDQTDTGWVAVAPAAGWVNAAPYVLEVRAVGALVQVRGALLVKTSAATVFNLGTVGGAFRPTRNVLLGARHGGYSSTGDFVGELMVSSAGVLSIPRYYYSGGLGSGAILPIGGMWFRG